MEEAEGIRVAIIGAGYMGSAHARVVSRIAAENPGLATLAYIVDVDQYRAKTTAARYGGKPLTSIRELPRKPADLAIIAVPTKHHLQAFTELIEKEVEAILVEKPMTLTLREAEKMLDTAKEAGIWVAVGHIERYNPALQSLRSILVKGRLGKPLTLTSRRVGPYAPRAGDTDVIYDLGIHEVDTALTLYSTIPENIKAYTLQSIVTNLNDYALTILGFPQGFASIEVNRLTPFKQRTLYLTTTKGVATLDYMKQTLTLYTEEEESHIRVKREEPLYVEDLDTILRLTSKKKPLVTIEQGFTAMLVCSAAIKSAQEKRDITLKDYEPYSRHEDTVKTALHELAENQQPETSPLNQTRHTSP